MYFYYLHNIKISFIFYPHKLHKKPMQTYTLNDDLYAAYCYRGGVLRLKINTDIDSTRIASAARAKIIIKIENQWPMLCACINRVSG